MIFASVELTNRRRAVPRRIFDLQVCGAVPLAWERWCSTLGIRCDWEAVMDECEGIRIGCELPAAYPKWGWPRLFEKETKSWAMH